MGPCRKRGERVVHGVDCAAGGVCSDGREERGVGNAEADFLAFHVAAALGGAHALVDTMEQWAMLSLGSVAAKTPAKNRTDMAEKTAQPCFGEPVISPSVEVNPAGIRKDRQKLEKVCERGGVFERMSRVGIEEAASVGAEHLNGFLRSDRTLSDGLRGNRSRDSLSVSAGVVTVCGSMSAAVS